LFRFRRFLTAANIENNFGTDVEIIPFLGGDIRIRDHDDSNGIWAEAVRIMRSRVSDEALQLPNSYGHSNATSNLSRLLQKLELYTGENAKVLHDHLKQSKLKV